MSIGTIIAIVAGIIIAGILGILLGIYILVNYLTSPSGFVKDLTGNEPALPQQPMDPSIMRMHVEALKNGEAE